jgi:DNA-binding winged helix-turn-helix (wHTH) protein/TolB-like protein/Tfp pilus assembly protein PilF
MQQVSPLARDTRFGVFWVDLRAGELHKNGHRIRLPEQPFQILAMLLERAGDVVTREELQQKLWPADTFVDFDHGLNNAIKKLRDVLDDSAEKPRYIETLPKRGYRFIHPVENPAAPAAAEPAPPAIAGIRSRWWWQHHALPRVSRSLLPAAPFVLAGLMLFNVGGFRDSLFGLKPRTPIGSIAVLPCKNLSGDTGNEFFADATADALTTELAQVKALRVPSATSSVFYKAERKKLPEIAAELNVHAVVECSLLERSAQLVVVNVQLIDSGDRHLWANRYELAAKDVPVLQSRIARDILKELSVPLTSREKSVLARERTVHPDANEAYLLGRHHFLSGLIGGRPKAKEYYEIAIQKDPGFARAYAALAELYAFGGRGMADGPLDGRVYARKWAAKAIELDDSHAEAHTALAWADMADWDWEGAEREFRRAIDLNPNYALARVRYGWFLSGMQRFPEALDEVRTARHLDPVSPFINNAAAWVFIEAGQVDEAIPHLQRILEREPNHQGSLTTLGFAFLVKEDYARAIPLLERASAENAPFPMGMMAYGLAKTGQRERALKIKNELERRKSSGQNLPPLAVAYAHLGFGDTDQTFAWLQKDYEEHRWMWTLAVNPLLKPLHTHPRFQELLRRIRLPLPGSTLAKSAVPERQGRTEQAKKK